MAKRKSQSRRKAEKADSATHTEDVAADPAAEQRQHPRVQLPLIVEVTHHVLGTVRAKAKDVSSGGIFIDLVDDRITVGAKLKVQIVTVASVDTRSTPTVDVTVARIAEDGLGLEFATRTAKYLWESVDKAHDELKIGRDYFQVYQSVVLKHLDRGVLLIQQSGKWLLPGVHLHVGEANVASLLEHLKSELGIADKLTLAPLATSNTADLSVPEAATFSVCYLAEISSDDIKLGASGEIKDWRWVRTTRDVIEITFALEEQRETLLPLMEDPAELPRNR